MKRMIMKNKYIIEGKGYWNKTIEGSLKLTIDTTDIVPGYGYINFNGTEKDLDIFCDQLIDEGEQNFKIIGIHKID